jgi:hypothetical protein
MSEKRKLRAWIGVVAAYAIALQALLTSVVATQMAVAAPSDPFAICWSGADGAGPQQQPTGTTHAAHQACIVCSFASAAAAPPSPTTVAVEPIRAATISWQTLYAPLHLERQRSPQIPQGPPQIA